MTFYDTYCVPSWWQVGYSEGWNRKEIETKNIPLADCPEYINGYKCGVLEKNAHDRDHVASEARKFGER